MKKIAIFADGADETQMVKRYREGGVQGFTTNPTLMAKAGIKSYEQFARSVLKEIRDLSVSFEVFSDDFAEMEAQALKIGSWGPNVHVKIPICNTKAESSLPMIRRLLDRGLKLNVTAILTEAQMLGFREVMKPQDDVIVSIFAGRIADMIAAEPLERTLQLPHSAGQFLEFGPDPLERGQRPELLAARARREPVPLLARGDVLGDA